MNAPVILLASTGTDGRKLVYQYPHLTADERKIEDDQRDVVQGEFSELDVDVLTAVLRPSPTHDMLAFSVDVGGITFLIRSFRLSACDAVSIALVYERGSATSRRSLFSLHGSYLSLLAHAMRREHKRSGFLTSELARMAALRDKMPSFHDACKAARGVSHLAQELSSFAEAIVAPGVLRIRVNRWILLSDLSGVPVTINPNNFRSAGAAGVTPSRIAAATCADAMPLGAIVLHPECPPCVLAAIGAHLTKKRRRVHVGTNELAACPGMGTAFQTICADYQAEFPATNFPVLMDILELVTMDHSAKPSPAAAVDPPSIGWDQVHSKNNFGVGSTASTGLSAGAGDVELTTIATFAKHFPYLQSRFIVRIVSWCVSRNILSVLPQTSAQLQRDMLEILQHHGGFATGRGTSASRDDPSSIWWDPAAAMTSQTVQPQVPPTYLARVLRSTVPSGGGGNISDQQIM